MSPDWVSNPGSLPLSDALPSALRGPAVCVRGCVCVRGVCVCV